MDSQKKQYFEQAQRWHENLNVILEKEGKYNGVLTDRYRKILNELKSKLKLYFYSYNFCIIEKHSFIEAKLEDGLLLVRIDFPEIFPDVHYIFKLSMIEESRREFLVYLIPNISTVYIPKISNIRVKPKDTKQIYNSISRMEDEFIFLDNKIEEINQMTFHYCFHNAQIKHDSINGLKNFDDFLAILINLLSN